MLDSFFVIVKIAELPFYPEGTKVSISNNGIFLQTPHFLQGTERTLKGDSRDDLHRLNNCINTACYTYIGKKCHDKNKTVHNMIINIFRKACDGLEIIRKLYDEHHIICHSIDNYRSIINRFLDENYEDDKDVMLSSYEWSEVEKLATCCLFEKIEKTSGKERQYYINSLDSFLEGMREKLDGRL